MICKIILDGVVTSNLKKSDLIWKILDFFLRLESDQRPTDLRNLGARVVSCVLRVYKVIFEGTFISSLEEDDTPP